MCLPSLRRCIWPEWMKLIHYHGKFEEYIDKDRLVFNFHCVISGKKYITRTMDHDPRLLVSSNIEYSTSKLLQHMSFNILIVILFVLVSKNLIVRLSPYYLIWVSLIVLPKLALNGLIKTTLSKSYLCNTSWKGNLCLLSDSLASNIVSNAQNTIIINCVIIRAIKEMRSSNSITDNIGVTWVCLHIKPGICPLHNHSPSTAVTN